MSERASRKDHPAGGLLRVQDRMPVGDGRGRGSWGRRGTLGATGPRRGAALGMDLEVPLGFAGEEGGSFGVARHGPWAAPGRRSSAVGRPRTQTGCQLATAASRGSWAGILDGGDRPYVRDRPCRGTCAVSLPVGNLRWMLQTRWPTFGAQPFPPGNHLRTRERLRARGGADGGRGVYERGDEPAGVWERHGATRRGP